MNPAGASAGLPQVGRQLAAVAITFGFAFVATLAIITLVERLIGFRVEEETEEVGVDLVEHGEIAYLFRERDRAAGRASGDLDEHALAVLREQLVLEATAKVLDSIREAESTPGVRPADRP